MKQRVQQIANFVSKVFASGASLSMLLLFLIIFVNSVRRYIFGKSLEWGEELPVYIAIYGVMFGAAWAYLQDRHIRFTMLVGFLSKKQERWLFLVVDLIMIFTSSLLAYSGWLFVIKRGGMESTGLIGVAKYLKELTGMDAMIWIGHFYPYQAAMIAGGVMLTLAALLKLLMRLSGEEDQTTSGV